VLREEDDLTDVVGVVGDLTIERLDHGMALSPDVHVAQQVVVLQRIERGEEDRPAAFPVGHDRCAIGWHVDLELAVAIAIGLLAIGREEIGEARPQVAGLVLHDDRDAVGLVVDRRVKLIVAHLRERPFRELLEFPELVTDVVDVCGFDHWQRSNGSGSPAAVRGPQSEFSNQRTADSGQRTADSDPDFITTRSSTACAASAGRCGRRRARASRRCRPPDR
jgi:hypothetical protein